MRTPQCVYVLTRYYKEFSIKQKTNRASCLCQFDAQEKIVKDSLFNKR